MFTVQQSEEEFRIVGPDGEEGDAVPYGEVAVLKIGPAIYYCDIEAPSADATVMCVQSVRPMPTECEEAEFEEEDDDEEEEIGGPVLVDAETGQDAPQVVK